MKPPQDLNLHIPAAIAALPELNLIEKVILARIHERPACSNGDLATLTGLSERGIESTLARLKKHGHIRSRGNGPARRLTVMFPVEPHSGCGNSASTKSHITCGRNQIGDTHSECGVSTNAEHRTSGVTQPEEIPLDPTNTKFLAKELDGLILCLPAGYFSQAREHLDKMRQWWSALLEKVPDSRAEAEGGLRVFDRIIFILEAGWRGLEMLPSYERERLIRLLSDTDPDRLAELQQQVEAITARGEHVDLRRLIVG